jgi:AraC-like DNA-binding protein
VATTHFNAADIFEFDQQPNTGDGFATYYHPKAGSIAIKPALFPHMHVMDMRWTIASDIELQDTIPSDNVAINFMLNGGIDSRFRGLSHDLKMRSKTHNLIHTPEAGHTNWMPGGQSMESLLISVNRDFFASAIGQSDVWSEQILADLEQKRPFSGAKEVQVITPQMSYLIDDIRNCKAAGPMRNLLIQSRVLELIALEIEQFRTPVSNTETLPADEVDKLYQLKAYLDINFLADHSLAQLSRYCLLNEFKVKKGFKQLFDTTVFNYIRKLRMDHAGQLLRNSTLSVDEVADKLGYEYSQHFSVAFKKFTGLTPSQYQHGRA